MRIFSAFWKPWWRRKDQHPYAQQEPRGDPCGSAGAADEGKHRTDRSKLLSADVVPGVAAASSALVSETLASPKQGQHMAVVGTEDVHQLSSSSTMPPPTPRGVARSAATAVSSTAEGDRGELVLHLHAESVKRRIPSRPAATPRGRRSRPVLHPLGPAKDRDVASPPDRVEPRSKSPRQPQTDTSHSGVAGRRHTPEWLAPGEGAQQQPPPHASTNNPRRSDSACTSQAPQMDPFLVVRSEESAPEGRTPSIHSATASATTDRGDRTLATGSVVASQERGNAAADIHQKTLPGEEEVMVKIVKHTSPLSHRWSSLSSPAVSLQDTATSRASASLYSFAERGVSMYRSGAIDQGSSHRLDCGRCNSTANLRGECVVASGNRRRSTSGVTGSRKCCRALSPASLAMSDTLRECTARNPEKEETYISLPSSARLMSSTIGSGGSVLSECELTIDVDGSTDGLPMEEVNMKKTVDASRGTAAVTSCGKAASKSPLCPCSQRSMEEMEGGELHVGGVLAPDPRSFRSTSFSSVSSAKPPGRLTTGLPSSPCHPCQTTQGGLNGSVHVALACSCRSEPNFRTEAAKRVLTLLVCRPPAAESERRSASGGVGEDGTSSATSPDGIVDETVSITGDASSVKSPLLRELVAEVYDGRHAALLLSVVPPSSPLGSYLIEATLRQLLAAASTRQAALAEGNRRDLDDAVGAAPQLGHLFTIEISIVALRGDESMRDLDEGGGRDVDVWAPTHPVRDAALGTWCAHATFRSIASFRDIERLMQPVRAWFEKSLETETDTVETLALYVTLRQINHLSRTVAERHGTLSSLLIYAARTPDNAVRHTLNEAQGTSLEEGLFIHVRNGCFTVAAVCVDGACEDTITVNTALCAEVSALRRGRIGRDDVGHDEAMLRTPHVQDGDPTEDDASADQEGVVGQPPHPTQLSQQVEGVLKDPAHDDRSFQSFRTPSPVRIERHTAEPARRPSFGSGCSSVDTSLVRPLQRCSAEEDHHSTPTVSEALKMFVDCRVYTVAAWAVEVPDGPGWSKDNRKEPSYLAHHVAQFVDEEVPPQRLTTRRRASFPPLGVPLVASHTSALCSLFAAGYNCAVLSYDGVNRSLTSSPAWSVITAAAARVLSRSDGISSHLRIAVSLVRLRGETRDLLTPEEPWHPLRLMISPMMGAAVQTSRTCPLDSLADVPCLLGSCLTSSLGSEWTSDTFLYVSLVQRSTVDEDVHVSSFDVTVTGSHTTVCSTIMSAVATPRRGMRAGVREGEGTGWPVHPEVARLHSGALAGSSATVFLMSLHSTEDAQTAVRLCSTAVAQLVKMPLRLGSVSNFVRRTSDALQPRRRRLRTAPEAAECCRWAYVREHASKILDDYMALLKPSDALVEFPRFYLSDSALPCFLEERWGTAPLAQTGYPQNVNSTDMNVSLDQPNEIAASPTLHAKSEDSRRASCSVRTGKCASAAKGLTLSPSLPLTPPCDSAEPPLWVLCVGMAGAAATAVTVSSTEVLWKPTGERFDADEVRFIEDGASLTSGFPTELPDSVLKIVANARAGRSCALFGVTDGRPHSHDFDGHPLWGSFASVLRSACFPEDLGGGIEEWLPGSELQFRMFAVQGRMLQRDFLTAEAPTALTASAVHVSLAIHPLCGPVVRNTTVRRATSLPECRLALRDGLQALDAWMSSLEYPRGTIVVANAVLKNVTRDDVLLSSLTAFSVRVDKDISAMQDNLAMHPTRATLPLLYHYALRGPCCVLCLTTLHSASLTHCAEALRLCQAIWSGASLPIPIGSLDRYICEQREQLARGREDDAADAPWRATTEKILQELMYLKRAAHAPMVFFPLYSDGLPFPIVTRGGYAEQLRHQSLRFLESDNDLTDSDGCARCQCTAVIAAASPATTPTVEAHSGAKVVSTASASYSFTEVLLLEDGASSLPKDLLSPVVDQLEKGQNGALVVVDGTDSSTGTMLLTSLVRTLLSRCKSEGRRSKIFLSLSAVRYPTTHDGDRDNGAATVKDLLTPDSGFFPLRTASSPFFGSCINGTRFVRLRCIEDVQRTFEDAQNACQATRATLHAVLVLKQVLLDVGGKKTEDVLLNSLLAVINTAQSNTGPYASSIFDTVLHRCTAATVPMVGKEGCETAVSDWPYDVLAQACGGQGFACGVVGMSADAPQAEVESLLRFGAHLTQLPCLPTPPASARAMLARAERHLHSCDHTPTSLTTQEEEVQWDWVQMKAEAEEMLRSPGTYKPRTYISV